MKKDDKFLHGPVADPTVVRAFTAHLLDAYESFIKSFAGTVDYVDGFMAIHNAHVMTIEHLVEETGDELWRLAARDTFARRMDNPGEQDTKNGSF